MGAERTWQIPIEKRGAVRYRVLKAAKLVSLNEWTYVDATVRDQSETGVRIQCESALTVADEFRLLILKDQTIQNCQVAWRTAHYLGAKFTAPARPAPIRKL